MTGVFGRPAPKIEKKKLSEKEKKDLELIPVLDVALDKETGNTKVVISGYRNIVEEIQAQKENSGFEFMYRQIQQGKALPGDFADDGKHGADVSDAPDNINDAFRRAMAAQQEAEKAAKNLGIPSVPKEDIEKIVNDRVQAILAKYAADTAPKGE